MYFLYKLSKQEFLYFSCTLMLVLITHVNGMFVYLQVLCNPIVMRDRVALFRGTYSDVPCCGLDLFHKFRNRISFVKLKNRVPSLKVLVPIEFIKPFGRILEQNRVYPIQPGIGGIARGQRVNYPWCHTWRECQGCLLEGLLRAKKAMRKMEVPSGGDGDVFFKQMPPVPDGVATLVSGIEETMTLGTLQFS